VQMHSSGSPAVCSACQFERTGPAAMSISLPCAVKPLCSLEFVKMNAVLPAKKALWTS
jgi:hypothetical protein